MAAIQEASQMAVMASITNLSPWYLRSGIGKDWIGKLSDGSYPDFISSNGKVTFIHMSADNRSKAGLKYYGFNVYGEQVVVILAWDANERDDPSNSLNKVYVMGGPQDIVDSITWDDVQSYLDNEATTTTCSSYGIEAKIENKPNNKVSLNVTINIVH